MLPEYGKGGKESETRVPVIHWNFHFHFLMLLPGLPRFLDALANDFSILAREEV